MSINARQKQLLHFFYHYNDSTENKENNNFFQTPSNNVINAISNEFQLTASKIKTWFRNENKKSLQNVLKNNNTTSSGDLLFINKGVNSIYDIVTIEEMHQFVNKICLMAPSSNTCAYKRTKNIQNNNNNNTETNMSDEKNEHKDKPIEIIYQKAKRVRREAGNDKQYVLTDEQLFHLSQTYKTNPELHQTEFRNSSKGQELMKKIDILLNKTFSERYIIKWLSTREQYLNNMLFPHEDVLERAFSNTMRSQLLKLSSVLCFVLCNDPVRLIHDTYGGFVNKIWNQFYHPIIRKQVMQSPENVLLLKKLFREQVFDSKWFRDYFLRTFIYECCIVESCCDEKTINELEFESIPTYQQVTNDNMFKNHLEDIELNNPMYFEDLKSNSNIPHFNSFDTQRFLNSIRILYNLDTMLTQDMLLNVCTAIQQFVSLHLQENTDFTLTRDNLYYKLQQILYRLLSHFHRSQHISMFTSTLYEFIQFHAEYIKNLLNIILEEKHSHSIQKFFDYLPKYITLRKSFNTR